MVMSFIDKKTRNLNIRCKLLYFGKCLIIEKQLDIHTA